MHILLLLGLLFASQANSCSHSSEVTTGDHIPAALIEHYQTASKCVAWQFRASIVEAQGSLCAPSSVDSWVAVKVLGVSVGNFSTLHNPSCLPFKLILAEGNFCLTFADGGVYVHGDLVIAGAQHTFGPDLVFPYSSIPGLSPRPGRLMALAATDPPIPPEKAVELAVQFFANKFLSTIHSVNVNFDEPSFGIKIKDITWTEATVGDVVLKLGQQAPTYIPISEVVVPATVKQLIVNTDLFGKPESVLLAAVIQVTLNGKPINFYPGCGGSKTGFDGPGITSYNIEFTGTDSVGKLLASILNKQIVQALVAIEVNKQIPSFVDVPPNPLYQLLFCGARVPVPNHALLRRSTPAAFVAGSPVPPTQFLIDWLNGMIKSRANTPFKLGDCTSTLNDIDLCGKASVKAQQDLNCKNCEWNCPSCGSVCCGCWSDYLNPVCGGCELARQSCLGLSYTCSAGCKFTEGVLEADAGLTRVHGLGGLTVNSVNLQQNNHWSFTATTGATVDVTAAAATYVRISPSIPLGTVQLDGQIDITCSGNAVSGANIASLQFDSSVLDAIINVFVTALRVAAKPVTVFVPSLDDKIAGLGDTLKSLLNGAIAGELKSQLQDQINKQLPLQNTPICL